MEVREIRPVDGSIDAEIEVPGSKSYTNRALVTAALAEGVTTLRRPLLCDDTKYMAEALMSLGVPVEVGESEMRVQGSGGRFRIPGSPLYLGNSGTSIRFLTAVVATSPEGRFVLDGNERMRQRPIQDLLDGLRQLGVRCRTLFGNGCPPVEVESSGIRGGRAAIPGERSSQYFSAILLAAPYAESRVEVEVLGDLVSKPYIDITLEVMGEFGVSAKNDSYRRFEVEGGQRYSPREYEVPGDCSSASYFFAAAAIAGGRVRVKNVGYPSAQGDIRFVEILREMGCEVRAGEFGVEVIGRDLRGVEVDMNSMSDVVPTLAAVSIFAQGPTTIKNVANMRIKETDRIAALAVELRKVGANVEEFPDGLRIEGGKLRGAEIETYDDHRMAMSMSLVGLRVGGIKIKNPRCVSKTFPGFFDILGKLYP
ncbi:MAG: 3-phosphoshikimate 1-carboxyvinyltransferase [bacterium]